MSANRLRCLFGLLVVVVALCTALGNAIGAPPAGPSLTLSDIYPAPAPAGWKHLRPAWGAVLWYPSAMHRVGTAAGAVTVAAQDSSGNLLWSLTAMPKPYAANMSAVDIAQRSKWPRVRLAQLRAGTASSVHLDAQAISIAVRGGIGSCVMDDYVTRVQPDTYREIACLEQGPHDSELIAVVRASAWDQLGIQLEDAVRAYQVT